MKRAAITVLGILGAFVAACAALSIPVEYGARQDQCIAEAGTRAETDDCRCRVRAEFPSAPSCTALPDGGWALPVPLASGTAMPAQPMAKVLDGGVR